jgi:hypothetical protein
VRVNGLALVIDRALASLPSVEPRRYRKALVLGSLREDVARAPFGGGVFEHLSLSHFGGGWLPGGFLPFLWPGPRFKVGRYFRRALAQARAGRAGAAYVTLGRACHVLTDMACPVHVHRVVHQEDPFEWYVEVHAAELAGAPAAPLPDAPSPAALVASLSGVTRAFAPDRTRNGLGRLLRRLGLRRGLPRGEIIRQARLLIPQAAAHVAALIRLFLVQSAPSHPPARETA